MLTVASVRSLFADRQQVKLQETPDVIPEGETPHTVSIFCFDDLGACDARRARGRFLTPRGCSRRCQAG
jgi:hypothetical protein